MDESKKEQIKKIIDGMESPDAMEIMNGFIFGPHGENEHYLVEDIQAILDEVKSAKVVEEKPLEINT